MQRILTLFNNFVIVKTIRTFWLDKLYRSLIYTTWFVLIAGTVVYHFVEQWRWIDAFYFSVVTLTTVGFGDFSPQTDAGKLFTIMYIVVGIGIILTFIDAVYTHFNANTLKRNKKVK